MGLYARVGKRLIDVVVSAALLAVLWPLLILIALAIRIEDGSPSLYVSERVGRSGRLFRFYKFRSMPVDTVAVPSAHATKFKITRVGRLIRRSNLDELPQLLNILKGDMSVVGPRPAIPSQHTLIELRRANRSIDCRPGLTGLAQVNSYDGMPEEEKAAHDSNYVHNISLLFDVKIVARTFVYLMKPPPVY